MKAWLDGDWSAVEGAFFDDWSEAKHVYEPFPVPPAWSRFRSMDWGYARPFSVGWWAVASDDFAGIPRGALVRYREWYGARKPNVGLRLDAEQVAEGILAREQCGERIDRTVADPSMFAQDGGPSLAERMAHKGVWAMRADNARVGRLGAMGGWDQMRARLRGDADGRPMLVVFLDVPGLHPHRASAASTTSRGLRISIRRPRTTRRTSASPQERWSRPSAAQCPSKMSVRPIVYGLAGSGGRRCIRA